MIYNNNMKAVGQGYQSYTGEITCLAAGSKN